MGRYISLAFFESFTRTNYTTLTTPTEAEVEEYITDSEVEIDEVTGRTWGIKYNVSELYDCPKQETLLKNTPLLLTTDATDDTDGVVIVDGDDNPLVEGIDEDYIIDGDFIVFNKRKSTPSRVYISYTSGYEDTRKDAKMLTALLTLQKIIQSGTAVQDNVESISVGSISISSQIGASSTVNIDKDTQRYWKRLRKLVR